MAGGDDAGRTGATSTVDDEPTIADGPRPETLPRGASLAPGAAQGSTIGRFMVLEAIGEGGMGAVYRAYDPKLQREVAVKVLKGAAGESERARVLREAQALAQLNHPNVVAVYDTGEHEGGVFIAMEYVLGQDLQGWLKTRRSWQAVVEIMAQAGRGLAAAHASELVHRDFKPANVLVGDDGRVRVVDFGLAKGTGHEDDHEPSISLSDEMALLLTSASSDGMSRRSLSEALTEEGLVMGTPSYMPPEQHFGRPADARADQFAFCVVLWEALTGKRPFEGRGVRELAKAKLKPLKIPSGSAPKWLLELAARGLARKPEKRWPSMEALLVELERDPGKTRRRWLAIGGLAVVVGGGVAANAIDDQRIALACAEEGATIEAIWSDTRAEQLRVAFEATGLPHASETFEKVKPWFDEYAQGWAARREQACLDAEQGTPGERPQLARECLEERKDALASTVEVLMSPDATSLPLAVDNAAALPELARCEDGLWLERRPRAPQDEETRNRVAEVRRQLSTVRSMQRAGQYEPALELALETLSAAERIGHPPLTVRAQLALAVLENQTGDYRRSAQLAEQSFHTAIETGDDEFALAAARQLVFFVGLSLARFDEGMAWGELAQSLLVRLDERDSLVDAALEENLGALHQARNENDLALERYQRSYELRRAALPPDHPSIGRAMSDLGRLHRARGEYDEAIAAHTEARRICEKAFGQKHPCVGSSLANIGHVQEGRGDYLAAKASYEGALEIFEASFGEDHPRLTFALRPLGLVHLVMGDLETAEAYYDRALKVNLDALGPDHPAVGTGLNSLGAFHKAKRDYPRAREFFQRSLELRERTLGPEHTEVARALTNLGSVEAWLDETELALVHLQRGLAIFEARDGASHPDVAWCLTELADVRRRRGEHVVAIAGYERALKIWEEFGGPDLEIAHTNSGLALSLLASDPEGERGHELARDMREVWANSGPTFSWVAGLMDDGIAAARARTTQIK